MSDPVTRVAYELRFGKGMIRLALTAIAALGAAVTPAWASTGAAVIDSRTVTAPSAPAPSESERVQPTRRTSRKILPI
jgi:hypothetical protein